MDNPTAEFRLIPFSDVRDAPFSPDRIERGSLRDRIVFARTSRGNFAKFQVQGGNDLLIKRLVVYDPAGCIIRTAARLTIRGSYRCDLDSASESGTVNDFWWEAISPGVNFLVPVGGAVFHLYRGFDDATFEELRAAAYSTAAIPSAFLGDQIFYCRTSRGQFAKLRVEAATTMTVRQLVVYRADGLVATSLANFTVPAGQSLDVDTGAVSATGADLRWDGAELTPLATAAVSYDSWYRFRHYYDLLNDAGIGAALLVSWAGAPLRDYAHWTDAERWQLWEFILLRATGRALPIAGPPALLRSDGPGISRCDAWKIYLAHVAHSLWLEADARVPWRILGASAERLEALFRMDSVIYQFGGGAFLGLTTQWNPQGSYMFLSSGRMVGSDHWSTIKNLVEWCRMNLLHGGGWGPGVGAEQDFLESLYGYRGPALVDRMIDPLPGHVHTTLGCAYTDPFLRSLLRTVNIPMRQGTTVFSGYYHSRAEFFTVGQNLAHGDDPYNGWTALGDGVVPIDRIFYTNAEIDLLIDHPVPRPGMTLSETTSYNHTARQMALAIEFMTQYLLDMRRIDNNMRLTGHDSRLWMGLHDHYSDDAIARIAADCDRAIAAIGH